MLCNNFDLYMKTATFILSNWLCIKEGHPPFERILWCRFPFLFLEKRHALGNFEDISLWSVGDEFEKNKKCTNRLHFFFHIKKIPFWLCLTRYCFEHNMGTTVVCIKQIPSLDWNLWIQNAPTQKLLYLHTLHKHTWSLHARNSG